jgi:hypothetical protein
MDTYVHVIPRMQEEDAAAKIAALFVLEDRRP